MDVRGQYSGLFAGFQYDRTGSITEQDARTLTDVLERLRAGMAACVTE